MYYVPGIVLEARETAVNKTDKTRLQGTYIPEVEDGKQNEKSYVGRSTG